MTEYRIDFVARRWDWSRPNVRGVVLAHVII